VAPVEPLPITVSVEVKDGLAPPRVRVPIPVKWSASGTLSACELDRPSMVVFEEYCCLGSYRTYLSSSTCFFVVRFSPPEPNDPQRANMNRAQSGRIQGQISSQVI
jgi:hypothetical protein